MPITKQLPFDLVQPVSFDLADFVVAPCNAVAVAFLDVWATNPSHFGAVVGPAGSGKSHLLAGWASENDAIAVDPRMNVSDLKAGGSYIVDDVDQLSGDGNFLFSDEYLFHLFNWSKEIGAKVLVGAQTPPNRWERSLPDLMSRLGTIPVASIEEPDDQILSAVMVKLFSDKQLQVDLEVINYLLGRMPRTFEAAKQLVEELDRMALAEKRRITKDLARRCLEQLGS